MSRIAGTAVGMLGLLCTGFAVAPEREVRLNDVQMIGVHNSYHVEPDQAIDLVMLWSHYNESRKWTGLKLIRALAYSHPPLTEQLMMGLRVFEIDVHDDPQGGRFSDPGFVHALEKFHLTVPFDTAPLRQPGFKVFHQADTDVRSTCLLFVDCLNEIRKWSVAHPSHLPIFIMIETKQDSKPAIADAYTPAAAAHFDAASWQRLQGEIEKVFPRTELLTPADVQGNARTLNQAVRTHGWPTLSQSRGKIAFMLLDDDDVQTSYVHSVPRSEWIIFPRLNAGDADAAWLHFENPLSGGSGIRHAVSQGYLVYTRADGETEEARADDTRRRDAAFASGAQLIGTDYPVRDPRLSDYHVRFAGYHFARCSPALRSSACPAQLEPESSRQLCGQ